MKKLIVITPSSNIVDEIKKTIEIKKNIQKAKVFLEELGIDVFFGELFYKKYFQYAWTVYERIFEIHNAFKNNDYSFIMSSQWWYNSNELLTSLDYDLIKKNYKPIIWLSDITILLNAIFTKTWKITYHWYDFLWQIWKAGRSFSKKQLDNFFNMNLFESVILWKKLSDKKEWDWILIWWCLASYSLILNTDFDPINLDKDFIFFIEDIGEPWDRILSYIQQLLDNDLFIKNCKWFILWNFSFCDFEMDKSLDLDEIISKKINSKLDIPILKIERIWHIVENYILPIWKNVKIYDGQLLLDI